MKYIGEKVSEKKSRLGVEGGVDAVRWVQKNIPTLFFWEVQGLRRQEKQVKLC